MSDLNKMWAALEAYQPRADKAGYGDSWLKMTQERTTMAALYAWACASSNASKAASSAAWAVEATDMNQAERYAARVIECIDRAMQEVKP